MCHKKGVTLRTGDVKGHISIKLHWCNAFVLKDETNLAQWCEFTSPNLQAMISSLDYFVSCESGLIVSATKHRDNIIRHNVIWPSGAAITYLTDFLSDHSAWVKGQQKIIYHGWMIQMSAFGINLTTVIKNLTDKTGLLLGKRQRQ